MSEQISDLTTSIFDIELIQDALAMPTPQYKPLSTIKPSDPAYQPIEHDPLARCHASRRGYTCTLNKHHTTNHAAHTPSLAHGHVIIHTWPQALRTIAAKHREEAAQ